MLIVGCAGAQPKRTEQPAAPCKPVRAARRTIQVGFDTGWSWLTDPDEECSQWSAALQEAKKLAGCNDEWRYSYKTDCQEAIRSCSPGCDICKVLEPGEGPSASFHEIRQDCDGTVFATTSLPGLFGGQDTDFDPGLTCGDITRLAYAMIHETTHACKSAGGDHILVDSYWVFAGIERRPECFSNYIVPPGKNRCVFPSPK
jgi:hypothetical protein